MFRNEHDETANSRPGSFLDDLDAKFGKKKTHAKAKFIIFEIKEIFRNETMKKRDPFH